MRNRLAEVNIDSAYAWKFHNVPKIYRGEFEKSDERLNQLHSDINIRFEKDQLKPLLKHLEGLMRKNVVADIKIPISQIPKMSPHHLDNENEIIDFEKISYTDLIITKVDKGRTIEIIGDTVKLNLDYLALTELFTRIYVSMELYATIEDNVIILKDINNSEIRLVL